MIIRTPSWCRSRITFKKLYLNYTFILVCLYPVLTYYSNAFIIYVIYFAMLGYIILRRKIVLDGLALYIIWLAGISVIYDIGNDTALNRTIGIVLFGLFILSMKNSDDLIRFKNIYKLLGWFAVCFMIIQVFCFYILKRGLMFRIPFLKLEPELEAAYRYLDLHSKIDLGTRFPGMFSEPSHHASFVIPLLIYVLFDERVVKKKKYIYAGLISMTLLFSTSGMGIIMGFVAWATYYLIKDSGNKRRIIMVPIYIGLVAIVFLFLMNFSTSFYSQMSNLFVVNNSLNGTSKADWRIYRGIEYFSKMPFFNKIFGIGFGNSIFFAVEHGITTSFDWIGEYKEFYAGFLQILIYTGIGGAIILLAHIINVWRKLCVKSKAMWVQYFLLLCAASVLFEGFACIYILLAHEINKSYMDEKMNNKIR